MSPSDATATLAAVTLADVARMAGVSKMTVSNVINNKPGVSEPTRRRVQRAVEQSGYLANPAARLLAGRRMNLIGVLAPRFGWPYVNEVVNGASGAAEQAGLNLAIFTTSEHPGVERERAALLRGLADGVLMVLPGLGAGDADTDPGLLLRGVPVVVVDAQGPHNVRADNAAGARQAVRHLLELGHRRIGHVLGPCQSRADAEERRAGFLAALAGAGLKAPPEYLQPGDYTEAGGERAGHALLSLPAPPSAIFAANDASALGVLRAAAALGLRVPRDLSVIGFDDVPLAAHTRPGLTTIRQPLHQMGAAGVRLLIELARGTAPPELHLRFPTELVRRDSTGPPPDS